MSLPPTALERNRSGIFHPLSVDLVFGTFLRTTHNVVAADIHGFDSTDSGFLAVVWLLMSASALVIFHVTADDFGVDGKPVKEVEKMIRFANDSKFHSGKVAAVFLWRDFEERRHQKLFDKVKLKLLSLSKPLGKRRLVASVVPVPQLNNLKSKQKRVHAVEKVSDAVETTLSDCESLPLMPNIRLLAHTLEDSATGRGKMPVLWTNINVTRCGLRRDLVIIRETVHGHLHQSHKELKGSTLFEYLFPFSTLDSDMARLEEEANRLAQRGLDDKTEQQIMNIQQQLKAAKERRLSNTNVSDFVQYFASVVNKSDSSLVQEFQRQLDAWKSPKCEQPLKERIELHSRIEARLSELRTQQTEPESDETLQQIKKQIQQNARQLDQFDISIDDVWSELMSMASAHIDTPRGKLSLLELRYHMKPTTVQDMYRQCVLEGHPMQLLRGRPLYMATDFLSKVLRGLSHEKHQSGKLFVVSVIGMQSSAKSTLLNYLFGCGFATRAGRCTKGLYASLVRSADLDVLVLDSEGLMSVEGGSTDFDNKVTLMAAACSHVLIINQKGEIHRQLRELLEVAVFALKHLQVLELTPDVWFVLRDQADLDLSALKSQFILMNQTLSEESAKLDVQLSKFVNLSPESVHLFPPAYDVQKRGNGVVKVPSELFSEKILHVRQKLFELYDTKFRDSSTGIAAFSSMPDWLAHVRTVWNAVLKFGGNLTHYESMHEIEQRKEVSECYRTVLQKYIEEEGYDKPCDKLLETKMSLPALEIAHGTVSVDLQNDLRVYAEQTLENAGEALELSLASGTYPARLRHEFQSKLIRRVEETKKLILSAWKQHEARKIAEVEMDKIQTSIERDMDAQVQGRQTTMDRAQLEDIFDSSWKQCLERTQLSLKRTMLTPADIARHVNRWIYDKVTSHPGEPVYVTLTARTTKTPEREEWMLNRPVESFREYVKVVQRTGPIEYVMAWVRSKQDHEKQIADWAVRRLHSTLCRHFQDLDGRHLLMRWKPDSAFCAQRVHETVSMIVTVQQMLQTRGSAKLEVDLEVKQFANDVLDCLRRWVIDRWAKKQEGDMKKRLDGLKTREGRIKQKIVSKLTGQESDMSTSKELADTVRDLLTDWVEKTVLQSSVGIRRDLRKNIESARAAAQHAYEESFGKEIWEDVVAYCTSASEFLRETFDRRFNWIAENMKLDDLVKIKKQMGDIVGKLKSAMKLWGERPEHKDPAVGRVTIQKFIEFATPYFQSSVLNSSSTLRVFQSLIPTDVNIAEPHCFAPRFVTDLDNPDQCEDFLFRLAEERMDDCLLQAHNEVWEAAAGCPETCPFCKAKCSLDKDHLTFGRKHECEIHILPALGGSGNKNNDGRCTPVFERCTSQKFIERPKKQLGRPDTVRPNLAEFYKDFHPNWSVPDCVPPADDNVHEMQQRRAWVNCRAPLMRTYSFLTSDTTPDAWLRYEKNPLT